MMNEKGSERSQTEDLDLHLLTDSLLHRYCKGTSQQRSKLEECLNEQPTGKTTIFSIGKMYESGRVI